jgi:hypothetical protein
LQASPARPWRTGEETAAKMQTIEGLKRTIGSTRDLQSLVKTMKAMAAVNIRQYEKALAIPADV